MILTILRWPNNRWQRTIARQIAALLLLLALVGCPTIPPVTWKTVQIANGCAVNARGYQASYEAMASQKKYFWTKILVIQLRAGNADGPNSHAICVVQWDDAIWAYDNVNGARRLSRDLKAEEDAIYLAEMWLPYGEDYVTAFFLEHPKPSVPSGAFEERNAGVVQGEGT